MAPDGQQLIDQYDGYERFVEGRPTFRVGLAGEGKAPVWLLGRDDNWHACYVSCFRSRSLRVDAEPVAIAPGTSGSPITVEDGSAVGVISLGEHMNPALASELPAWLVKRWFGAV